MTQHKWHKEIKAWADGAEIEGTHGLFDWYLIDYPNWHGDNVQFRIKQQPQPKVKKWLWASADGHDSTLGFHESGEAADKYEGSFDGLLYTIKLTWSETEFEVGCE